MLKQPIQSTSNGESRQRDGAPERLAFFEGVFDQEEEVEMVALDPSEICPRSTCSPRDLTLL